MKKVLLAPLLIAAATVSTAWSAQCGNYFCQWSSGCFSIDPDYAGENENDPLRGKPCPDQIANCETNGYLYTGVTGLSEDNNWGRNLNCATQGGTWAGTGNNPNQSFGWCDYGDCVNPTSDGYGCNGGGGCYEIKSEEKNADCQDNGKPIASLSECAPNSKVPADGGPAGGTTPSAYCCWVGNSYNNYSGYCGPINATTTEASCLADSGELVSNCNSCDVTGSGSGPTNPPSGNTPSYCEQYPNDASCNGNSPIIALPNAAVTNAISAMSNSVSLQVTGTATVRIYDMKGTALRVQRVEKGSYVVQLSNLPRGLYIVQAASGSWRQTAKVAVK